MNNTAVLIFKEHMGLAPHYVGDLLNTAPARYGSNNYVLPRTRIDLYKTSFAFSGHRFGTLSLRSEIIQVCAWF